MKKERKNERITSINIGRKKQTKKETKKEGKKRNEKDRR